MFNSFKVISNFSFTEEVWFTSKDSWLSFSVLIVVLLFSVWTNRAQLCLLPCLVFLKALRVWGRPCGAIAIWSWANWSNLLLNWKTDAPPSNTGTTLFRWRIELMAAGAPGQWMETSVDSRQGDTFKFLPDLFPDKLLLHIWIVKQEEILMKVKIFVLIVTLWPSSYSVG